MNAAQTREDAKKRWSEIVSEIEAEKVQLQKEINDLKLEKSRLNKVVKSARTRSAMITSLAGVAKASLEQATETKRLVDSSKKIVDDIATKSTKLQADIESTNAKALSNNALINQQLDKADKAALSGDFKHYAGNYGLRADFYLAGVVVTIATFVLLLLRFNLLDLPNDPQWTDILAFGLRKIAIAAPFVYLVYLFSSMQREARRLERSYRFKSAVALSLKANKELLAELYSKDFSIKGSKDEAIYPIAEFAKGIIENNIYKEPEEIISKIDSPEKDAPDLSFWANRQTKRALSLLKEFSEIVKNLKSVS